MTSQSPIPITPVLQPGIETALSLGLVSAEPVLVAPSGPALVSEIETLAVSLARRHAGTPPSEIEGLAPARALYRSFGIDPTRTRPSSEALLRRAVAGKPLPRILNAVDLCNLCALRFLLPIGLYDAARIRGNVTLRRGATAESYEGIRKDEVHLAGRPVLADEEGPFGNPTSDSLRTSVTLATRSLWMVIFAPAGTRPELLEAHVQSSCESMRLHLGSTEAPVATHGRVLMGHS
ncbi:MAG TPA: phenylalanine--tRNA ligase beta subunit-related protein [Candidatus Polarisedimenticolia bacterium]|nr:phenylalanine--tRNA ligase beta subunit-related protein [Candidatus Polarisedimenticolia bacterium]